MLRGKKIGKTWTKRKRKINGVYRWVKVRKINGIEQIKILKWTKNSQLKGRVSSKIFR